MGLLIAHDTGATGVSCGVGHLFGLFRWGRVSEEEEEEEEEEDVGSEDLLLATTSFWQA